MIKKTERYSTPEAEILEAGFGDILCQSPQSGEDVNNPGNWSGYNGWN